MRNPFRLLGIAAVVGSAIVIWDGGREGFSSLWEATAPVPAIQLQPEASSVAHTSGSHSAATVTRESTVSLRADATVPAPTVPPEAQIPGASANEFPPEALPSSARSPDSPGAAEFEERRADARRFIASLYRDFGGAKGDERAVALWADLIAAGTWTREQAVEHFLDSAATLQGAAPLARLYFAYFQRVPDEAGWSHWRNVVASGQSLQGISDQFVASPEFTAIYGALDDAQFVDLVFRNTLGRAASPAELTLWQAQFVAGLASRGQMMLAFADTQEYRDAVAGEVNASLLYSGLLRRSADTPGLAAWMQTVEARRITRSDMIAGFLDSPEYRSRNEMGSESFPGK